MNPYDTYRFAFLKFRSEGMSYAEAAAQFGKRELQDASMEELRNHGTIEKCSMAASDDELSLFDLMTRASWEQRQQRDLEEQAIPLWLAGWTSENANPNRAESKHFWGQTQVMSWYWRAPSKRPGKPGRRYLSTQQAFNAMRKAQKS